MAASADCRFCQVKPTKENPKLNNLTAQLLQYFYLDEFYFYFSKPVNEILSHSPSQEFYAFKELQYQIGCQKLDFSYYTRRDCSVVVQKRALKRGDERYRPYIHSQKSFTILLKGDHRKKHLNKRSNEEYDEKNKFLRKKNQFPLRQQNFLRGEGEFVDIESFETAVHDIYSPDFTIQSSQEQSKVNAVAQRLTHQGAHLAKAIQEKSFKPKTKVQIPLLCIQNKMKGGRKVEEGSAGSEKHRVKVKDNLSSRHGQLAGVSENQSTQFSITCNLNNKSRGKYEVEGDKIKAGGSILSLRKPISKYSSSPKISKKKKHIDSHSRPEKKSSKRVGDSREFSSRMLLSGSFFNMKNLKLLKSSDSIMFSKLKGSTIDFSKNKPDKKQYSTKVDDFFENSTAKILQSSYESFRGLTSRVKSTKQQLMVSPKLATDRHHPTRESAAGAPSHQSFKDKFNLKESKVCLLKRFHKPLWIQTGENLGLKDFIKNARAAKSKSKDKTVGKDKIKDKSKSRETSIKGIQMLSRNHFLTSRTSKPTEKTLSRFEDKVKLNTDRSRGRSGRSVDQKAYIFEEILASKKNKDLPLIQFNMHKKSSSKKQVKSQKSLKRSQQKSKG